MAMNTGTLIGKTYQNYCELQEQVYLAWKALFIRSTYRNEILEKRANELTEACRYYLYERDINVDLFLKSASQCTYVYECTLNTPFIQAIRKKKWNLIKGMRYLYLAKIKIAKIIHR